MPVPNTLKNTALTLTEESFNLGRKEMRNVSNDDEDRSDMWPSSACAPVSSTRIPAAV